MEESRAERIDRFAAMHVAARKQADRSQRFMAHELGVSIKTIQSWEKGMSSPSFFQSLEWFRVLHINPLPRLMEFIYPDLAKSEEAEAEFARLSEMIPASAKETINFLFLGKHGASPNAVLQMITAYLQSPPQIRLSQAVNIYYMYSLVNEMGLQTCKQDLLPDVNILLDSIRRSRASIVTNEKGDDVV